MLLFPLLEMEEEAYVVVIEGGSPWGFGIQGGQDFRSPLRVKMVSQYHVATYTVVAHCYACRTYTYS